MMFNGLCHTGTWGSLGTMGIWGWAGMLLSLVFWVGLFAGPTLLAVRAMKRARVPGAIRQPSAREIQQAQYARGEITREQYERMKQDIE